MNLDLSKLKYNHDFLKEIRPNIWLMDNHKWAWYVWEKYRSNNKGQIPPILIHIDKHLDSCNDFHTDEQQDYLRGMTLETIRKITKKRNYFIKNEPNILNKNYLIPAVIRGYIKELHFYCKEAPRDPGLYPEILVKYDVQFYNYKVIDELVKSTETKPSILDIDLDLFNKSETWDEGELWKDDKILEFIDKCSQIICNASVITIAMSFGFSGSEYDTRYLVKLVLPKIIEYRKS